MGGKPRKRCANCRQLERWLDEGFCLDCKETPLFRLGYDRGYSEGFAQGRDLGYGEGFASERPAPSEAIG